MKLYELLIEGLKDLTHYVRSPNSNGVAIAFCQCACDSCGDSGCKTSTTMSVSDAKDLRLEEVSELPPDLFDADGKFVCKHCKSNKVGELDRY